MSEIDFQGLNQALLQRCREYLPIWLPGGRIEGSEYVCADRNGGSGNSFKVNTVSGKWADFSLTESERGGDLISLYANIHRCTQVDAARSLSDSIGLLTLTKNQSSVYAASDKLAPPPPGTPLPNFAHHIYGKSVAQWCYRDRNGSVLFYISRHNTPDGSKVFVPWSWSVVTHKWVKQGWPMPRPMYGLDKLSKDEKSILVVEGEAAADAARTIVGRSYDVLSWPNGVNGVQAVDLSPLHNRKILLWPDADSSHLYPTSHPLAGQTKPYTEQPGPHAMQRIAEKVLSHCKEVKVLNVEGMSDGWDAVDALKEGMDLERFLIWGKPRAKIFEPSPNEKTASANEPSSPLKEKWKELNLVLSEKGYPVLNADNVLRVFEKDAHFQNKIWFDEFHKKIFMLNKGVCLEFSDSDIQQLQITLQRFYGLRRISKGDIETALYTMAKKNLKNEPKDWLNSLEWDKKERIETFFINYMGAEDTSFHRAVGKNFFISMVARIMSPGCKVDNMVILEGKQGLFKSTALNILAGDWFTETNEDPRSKDFYQIIQGAMLIEIAELDSFTRSRDSSDSLVKKTITCRIDRFRAPYERQPSNNPRSCVFVGTTNQREYLRDPTGARRFWPIEVTQINRDAIQEDRSQLFAEAVALFKAGAKWYEVPTEEARVAQEGRRKSDEWESVIVRFMEDKRSIALEDLFLDCLNISRDKIDRRSQDRVTPILRRLGYEPQNLRVVGQQKKIWINTSVEGIEYRSKFNI